MQESLRNNETYRQISHMEDKLGDLLKDNKSLQTSIDELNKVILEFLISQSATFNLYLSFKGI